MPAQRFETDEQLARRLQEEEYQRAQDIAAPQREQPLPERISPSELRRRRLARFGS